MKRHGFGGTFGGKGPRPRPIRNGNVTIVKTVSCYSMLNIGVAILLSEGPTPDQWTRGIEMRQMNRSEDKCLFFQSTVLQYIGLVPINRLSTVSVLSLGLDYLTFRYKKRGAGVECVRDCYKGGLFLWKVLFDVLGRSVKSLFLFYLHLIF